MQTTTSTSKLLELADKLNQIGQSIPQKELAKIEDVSNEVGLAWSGSWLGYQSRVYYKDLLPPPPGARFSKEWGFMDSYSREGTIGEWAEYEFNSIVEHILKKSKVKNFESFKSKSESVSSKLSNHQLNALSILSHFKKNA